MKNKDFDISPTDRLSLIYNEYLENEGLEKLSADEFDVNKLTENQREWIEAFINFWNVCEGQ